MEVRLFLLRRAEPCQRLGPDTVRHRLAENSPNGSSQLDSGACPIGGLPGVPHAEGKLCVCGGKPVGDHQPAANRLRDALGLRHQSKVPNAAMPRTAPNPAPEAATLVGVLLLLASLIMAGRLTRLKKEVRG
ncbi:MAG: hypothetical protein M3R05_06740 [Chloroflexota bacterium]|nr:hypothetical protein [Chloroflexota bacterium]